MSKASDYKNLKEIREYLEQACREKAESIFDAVSGLETGWFEPPAGIKCEDEPDFARVLIEGGLAETLPPRKELEAIIDSAKESLVKGESLDVLSLAEKAAPKFQGDLAAIVDYLVKDDVPGERSNIDRLYELVGWDRSLPQPHLAPVEKQLAPPVGFDWYDQTEITSSESPRPETRAAMECSRLESMIQGCRETMEAISADIIAPLRDGGVEMDMAVRGSTAKIGLAGGDVSRFPSKEELLLHSRRWANSLLTGENPELVRTRAKEVFPDFKGDMLQVVGYLSLSEEQTESIVAPRLRVDRLYDFIRWANMSPHYDTVPSWVHREYIQV